MHIKGRVEEIVDDYLKRFSVEVNKFGNIEEDLGRGLKYDIWCDGEEEVLSIQKGLSFLFSKEIDDYVGCQDKYFNDIYFYW